MADKIAHHERRRAAAGRHADRGLPASGQPVRRAVRRQPDHERGRRRGAATANGTGTAPASARASAVAARRARAAKLHGGGACTARTNWCSASGPRACGVARSRRRGPSPVEAHIIEPLGAYDIVDLEGRPAVLRARTASGFVARSRRRRCGAARRGADALLQQAHAASRCASGCVDDMAHVSLDRRHQADSAPCAPSATLTLDIADGEFFVLLGPTGAGKTHDAAADRRPRQPDDGRSSHRRRGRQRLERRRSATWRWCSSTTRSIRTTRCARTWSSRSSRSCAISARSEIEERVAQGRGDAAHRASARAQDRPAVGRRDAARLDRPRHRARAARVPDGRAAVQPRRQAARGAARRAQGPADEARRDLPVRHARPGRGDDDGRQDRRRSTRAASSRSARRTRSTTRRATPSSPRLSARRR